MVIVRNITDKIIYVNLAKIDVGGQHTFMDTFKKTQEFKNLIRDKYIEEVDTNEE